ncbi:MAG: SdiA-regulated domain-containing protein, partial [Vitreimonas sp.]
MTTKAAPILALALAACAPPHEHARAQTSENSLFGAEPAEQWRLPDRLREISGLAVSADGRLFGHDDEQGVIYEINAAQGRLVKAFALGDPPLAGDFEGLAIAPDGTFWLTTSRGELYRFREGGDGAHVEYARFDSGLGEICEVEGIAYLAAEESLILACKHNHARDMRDRIAIYIWRMPGEAKLWLNLPEDALASATGERHFRSSAIDVDARSGRLLLMSAGDAALVELDAQGDVVSARSLEGAHRQPEGVAVLPNGALAIADEAGGRGNSALLSIYPG